MRKPAVATDVKSTNNIQARTLRKAEELLGGRRNLAAHLGVKAEEIEQWMTSNRPIPRALFLRVVEVLLDEAEGGSSADFPDPPPERSAAALSRYD